MRCFLLFVFLLIGIGEINAQYLSFKDSINTRYKFIDFTYNEIQNNESALKNFYNLLYLQEKNNNQKINISHIGDSHIQADFFSGKVRRSFQRKFGNAGRGLVFPYRVAKTNEPWGVHSEGHGVWESKRCVFYEKPLPIGISGITIKCTDSSSEVSINVLNQEDMDYRFDRLTLFHEKGAEAFDLLALDQSHNIRGFINSNLVQKEKFVSRIQLDTLISYIKFKSYKRDSSVQKFTQIYGVYLEKGNSGIVYNMTGVNGAEFPHYNRASLFQEQEKILNNNLFIISLGTNDLVPTHPNISRIILDIDTLVSNLRFYNPDASILITGSGDFLKKRKVKNKFTELFSDSLSSYCKVHNIAYWDWFRIMGGLGSINLFFKKGLAQADKLHLTRAGYELEGELLYYALMQGYESFKALKP
jgi:lysophospholipase L1-like esterase